MAGGLFQGKSVMSQLNETEMLLKLVGETFFHGKTKEIPITLLFHSQVIPTRVHLHIGTKIHTWGSIAAVSMIYTTWKQLR